jgi:hypothetical protein
MPQYVLLPVVLLAYLAAQNLAQFIGLVSCAIGIYQLLFLSEETKSFARTFKHSIAKVKYTDRHVTYFAYGVGLVVAGIAFIAFLAVWLEGFHTGNWILYLLALAVELVVGSVLAMLVLAPIPLAKRIARI